MMGRGAKFTDREAALERLGRLARAELVGSVSPEEVTKSRFRYRESLARETARPHVVRWIGGSSAAVAVLAGAAFFGLRTWARPPLTFKVDSAEVGDQDYFLVPASSPSAHVRFSDGSDMMLEPGARGRVAALHADGATIGLESGKASLEVVHRPGTRWSVDAGPFAIAVTGTSFDVAWSGTDQVFEVTLRSGSVNVRGPMATAGIQLAAGERLVANLKEGQLRVEHPAPSASAFARDAFPPSGETEPGAPVDDGSPRRADAPQGRASTGSTDARREWSKRVAAGDFDAVLAEAQEGGLDSALARSSLSDLVALADAARYRGRTEVARRALLAQRERFSSSTTARTAAFLLGRLAEAEPQAAIGWYDRYLGEAPNGEFASEALGRKLVAVQSLSGPQAARPIANEYLRRFPRGAYAQKARELASQ
jgi:ferric-dicitrate binding protein FerR (iron transport regulator)